METERRAKVGRTRFSEEQSIGILKEADRGRLVKEVIREYGISGDTFCRRRRKFRGLEVSDALPTSRRSTFTSSFVRGKASALSGSRLMTTACSVTTPWLR